MKAGERSMRLHILSDLHREVWRCFPDEPEYAVQNTGADVLVLAGDVDAGHRGILWAASEGQRLGIPVVYVAGNHEFYHHEYHATVARMRKVAQEQGVHFLECDAVVIAGVRFLGTTLWTDFRSGLLDGRPVSRELAVHEALLGLRDFTATRINKGDGRVPELHPLDTVGFHRKARAWLNRQLREPFPGPTVVVTHHSPTARARHPECGSTPMDAAFISDLHQLTRKATLWIHGHTHYNLRLRDRDGWQVSNCRGYPGEYPGQGAAGFDPGFVVEI